MRRFPVDLRCVEPPPPPLPEADAHADDQQYEQSTRPCLTNSSYGSPVTVSFKAVSLNVLTLGKANKQAGLRVRGRARFIQQQLAQCNASVIGVQEARTSGPHTRTGEHYHVISSGCEPRAVLGVELWCAKVIQRSKGKPIAVASEDLQLIYHDSRRLLVALRNEHIALDFFVAHAPCETQKDEGWWGTTRTILARYANPAILGTMIDAN